MMNTRTAILIALSACTAVSQAEEFRVTVTNLGPQPLSPVFLSASNASFDTFQIGGMASLGIKNIAETGNTAAMIGLAGAAGSAVASWAVAGNAPIGPGGSAMAMLMADMDHDYLSFASMLGKTNDGFIGESVSSLGARLFENGQPRSFSWTVLGSRAWDAGTEDNTQNAADLGFLGGSGNPAEMAGNDHIRVHGTIIPNFGDSWALMPDWMLNDQVARIDVTAVPEPGTILALSAGVLVLLHRRTRKS